MPPLPSPIDRSPSYPRSKLNFLFRPGYTASKLKGAIQNAEGDLTTDAAAKITRDVGAYVYHALAYAELIEFATTRLEAQATVSAAVQERILQELSNLNSQVQSLQTLMQSMVNAQGVMIPHWQTQKEVEQGDDMGMNVPGAADLGLVVEMHFLQNEPGYAHGQVASINPPPDTLVRIGSTVVVEINLTG